MWQSGLETGWERHEQRTERMPKERVKVWRWQRKLKHAGRVIRCQVHGCFMWFTRRKLTQKSCQEHVDGGLKMMDSLSRVVKELEFGWEKDGGGGEDGTGHCHVTGGYLSVWPAGHYVRPSLLTRFSSSCSGLVFDSSFPRFSWNSPSSSTLPFPLSLSAFILQ